MHELLTIDADTYYSDLCSGPDAPPTLTQSMAHTLISQSPLHAWRRHPRLGNQEQEETAAMTRGTMVHAMLTGETGLENVEIMPFDTYLSGAAKAAKKDCIARGKVPMKQKEYDDCRDAANAALKLKDSLAHYGIRFDGQTEGVVLWHETASNGNIVPCRCRIDHWLPELAMILDPKSTDDVNPTKLGKRMVNGGMDIQAAAYRSAISNKFPNMAGRVQFQNVFIESKRPHDIVPVKPSAIMLRLGQLKWQRAIDLFEICTRTGKWSGYAERPIEISPPNYALMDEAEANPEAAELLA